MYIYDIIKIKKVFIITSFNISLNHQVPIEAACKVERIPNNNSSKITCVALKILKILTAPVAISFYLLAIPVQAITSYGIGIITPNKNAHKTFMFGLTFFYRQLSSSFACITGKEIKGGAPYTPRSEISKGIIVSRLPFKKDVDTIAKELHIETQKKLNKKDFFAQVEASSISDPTKQSLKKLYEKQQIDGNIQGLVIDVTEPEETTWVLGQGAAAAQDDWNKKGIVYINFPSEDMKAVETRLNLDLAELAQISRVCGAGALIHCAKGIGRSLTIGLTAHTIYGNQNDQDLAPTVPSAIKDIKQKRAYGLNRQQELVVYRSKLESYLAYLESKTHEPSSVDAETINCVKEAVSRGDNLQDLVILGKSSRHLLLRQLLQQQQEAVLRAMN